MKPNNPDMLAGITIQDEQTVTIPLLPKDYSDGTVRHFILRENLNFSVNLIFSVLNFLLKL